MLGKLRTHRRVAAVAVSVVVLGATVLAWPSQASHQPADKIGAAGSTVAVTQVGEEIVLLRQFMRSSAPADLILEAALECSIVTDVTTMGNDDQFAKSTIKIWVEIDDEVVPVSSEDDTEPGKVVACNRRYQRETLNFENEDATIATFFSTKSTHGFNWLALNLGNGIHKVELVAELTTDASERGNAEAVVGKRTLIGTPVHLPHDATVDGEVEPNEPNE